MLRYSKDSPETQEKGAEYLEKHSSNGVSDSVDEISAMVESLE